MTRYVLYGHVTADLDSDLAPDGSHPPFQVFDDKEAKLLDRRYGRVEDAQPFVDGMNAIAPLVTDDWRMEGDDYRGWDIYAADVSIAHVTAILYDGSGGHKETGSVIRSRATSEAYARHVLKCLQQHDKLVRRLQDLADSVRYIPLGLGPLKQLQMTDRLLDSLKETS